MHNLYCNQYIVGFIFFDDECIPFQSAMIYHSSPDNYDKQLVEYTPNLN